MAYSEEDVLRTLPGVRPVLEQVAHKWTILILTFLCEEPKRFNALKGRLDGMSQKALTDALRRLERNGLVERRVISSSPVAVLYSITPLRRGLQEPFLLLYDWAVRHQGDLKRAQDSFDRRQLETARLI